VENKSLGPSIKTEIEIEEEEEMSNNSNYYSGSGGGPVSSSPVSTYFSSFALFEYSPPGER